MLDEIDYGMLLLGDDGDVLHLNHAARLELGRDHPLQLLGRQLRARQPKDVARLHDLLAGALERGLRRMVQLGEGPGRVAILAVPVGPGLALVNLGRRGISERLSIQCYARESGLTPKETEVLQALSEGHDPRDIAELHEVGLATVRTQIGSIRAKTGAANIRTLVRRLAQLPPMLSALRA